METETAVTAAVETVAEGLTLNKTIIIAAGAALAGGVIAVVSVKFAAKLKARFADAIAETETQNA